MNPLANLFSGSSLTRTALETFPSAVFVTNESGTILYANEKVCHWFGYAASEILGRPLDRLLPGIRCRDHYAHSALRMSQPAGPMLNPARQLCVCKDGSRVMVNVTFVAVHEQARSMILANVVKTAEEATDHEFLEAERLDAIAKMISGLAHKSRNALQRAVACLDLLELDLGEDDRQMELSRKIRQSLSDLLENYDEVKRFAQPITLQKSVSNLLPICRDAYEEVMAERNVAPHELIIVKHHDNDDVANVDRNKLREVFLHVLQNAVDRPMSHAKIVVDSVPAEVRSDAALRVSVHDDGEGFTKEALERAFEPFFTTKQHGTGLGLSICRRIIKAHGGVIRASNSKEGGGLIEILLSKNFSAEFPAE
jgi:PAS domain S-box-containing protein